MFGRPTRSQGELCGKPRIDAVDREMLAGDESNPVVLEVEFTEHGVCSDSVIREPWEPIQEEKRLFSRSEVRVRAMQSQDVDRVAAIFRVAFNEMYGRRGYGPVVTDVSVGAAIARTYLEHDREHCLVVLRGERVVGSGFLHVRGGTGGVGPITIDPGHQSSGAGRVLMEEICRRADQAGVRSLRLIQDAFNEVSFALYGRLGFVSREVLARGSFRARPNLPARASVRRATRTDLARIVELEREVLGLERPKDYEFLFRTAEIIVADDSGLQGSLTRLVRGRVAVIGPAIARDLPTILGLAAAATHDLPTRSEVRLLLPAGRGDLLSAAYQAGFQVHSLCTYMVRGSFTPFSGYYVPTLFPESG